MSHAPLSSIPHQSLRALRAALVRDLGDQFAGPLQEAGYAGGATVLEALGEWCARHGLGAPAELPMPRFREAMRGFFREAGWGDVTFEAIGDVAIALDAAEWAEADPSAPMPYPACFYSAGMLADLFGRVAEGPLACLEVACRSSGAPACRFLLGSPEVLGRVYEQMVEGADHREALRAIP